jgi:Na+-driven multidrug efflux pump
MRTPIEKFEKADKRLKTALVFCLFMGIFLLGFTLVIYLKHFLSKDADRPVPVAVYQDFIVGTRVVVYMMLPLVGFGYLLVGYRIWYYRSKRNAVKEHDKIDA